MSTAILMVKKLFTFPMHYEFGKIFQIPMPHNYFLISGWLIVFLVIIELLNEKGWLLKLFSRFPKIVQLVMCQIFLVCLIYYGYWFKGHNSFIYFQF
jgi:hypothetical protein